MFESQTVDHLHLLARQFDGLAAQDVDPNTALQRIADAVPDRYAQDATRLRALVTADGDIDLPSVGASPYSRLASLAKATRLDARGRVQLLRDFSDYVTQTKLVIATYWAGFRGFILYTLALVGIALLITGMFSVFVIPAFRGLFSMTGGRLPVFSAALLGGERILPALLLITALVVAGLIVFSGVTVRNRLQRMAPLPGWVTLLPGLGRLRESWHRDLYLNTLRLLRKAGVDDTDAQSTAAEQTGFDAALARRDSAMEALAIAEPLGLLDAELDAQCSDHVARLTDDLLAARDRIAFATKVILYAVIALLVVAMYQPLFQMGAII
ncbi:MAG: hypothetical protein AAF545_04725 [Pseudomonadota bacterium]